MTRPIDHILREMLHARAAGTPPTPCLDAESAAALVDETLSAHERAGAEAHVADCARCQALLAALATMTPAPAGRAWWRRPAIAWLAPLAVAATAVIIWVSVPWRTFIEPARQSARASTRSVESDASRMQPDAAAAKTRGQVPRDFAAPRPEAPGSAAKQEHERMPAKQVPAATQPSTLADSRVSAPAAAPGPALAEARQADALSPPTSLPSAATPPPPPSVPSVAPGSRLSAPAEQTPQPPVT